VASLSQGRTAAAQCGLFTHKSVPVIFEPPCISLSSVCTGVHHCWTVRSVRSRVEPPPEGHQSAV